MATLLKIHVFALYILINLFIFVIIYFYSAVCLYEQKSSDVTVNSDVDEDSNSTRGFTSAVLLPLDQGLLCVTADQQFLFYSPEEHLEENWYLKLSKRLVGFNDEILDMKFLDEEEQYLAVATNLEQVISVLASAASGYYDTQKSVIWMLDDSILNLISDLDLILLPIGPFPAVFD